MPTKKVLVMVVAVSTLGVDIARADRTDALPKELDGVGISEKLGAQMPLATPLSTAEGKSVVLGDLLASGRPVLLTLNYASCPMLCNLQLDGLVGGLKGMPWELGQKYDVVTLSIDPNEVPARALAMKKKYVEAYGRGGGDAGWHFVMGTQESIDAIASAVGFGYRYVPEKKEFAHAAAAVVLSPTGMISRYLYGITYEPDTVRLSLVEASEGKVGSVVDQLMLFCFQYDASAGRYTPFAKNLMRLGGAFTVLLLGLALAVFWMRESRQKRAAQNQTA